MKKYRLGLILLSLVVFVTCKGRTADPRELFKRGKEAYDAGEYNKARAFFRLAKGEAKWRNLDSLRAYAILGQAYSEVALGDTHNAVPRMVEGATLLYKAVGGDEAAFQIGNTAFDLMKLNRFKEADSIAKLPLLIWQNAGKEKYLHIANAYFIRGYINYKWGKDSIAVEFYKKSKDYLNKIEEIDVAGMITKVDSFMNMARKGIR